MPVETDEEKVEVFNAVFASVFKPGVGHEEIPPRIFDELIHDELDMVSFPPEVVEKKLLELKPSSAPGSDSIHPRVLKSCASALKVPLSIMFEESMRSGCLPSQWKCTNITPIFKSGKKKLATNSGVYKQGTQASKSIREISELLCVLHLPVT